jgi:hypothetical protein
VTINDDRAPIVIGRKSWIRSEKQWQTNTCKIVYMKRDEAMSFYTFGETFALNTSDGMKMRGWGRCCIVI